MATNEEEEIHSQYPMQLASASLVPMVLKAAIELGVLDILHRAGRGTLLSATQIASQLPSNKNPGAHLVLDRMLCLLSAYSVLTCCVTSHQTDGESLRLYGLSCHLSPNISSNGCYMAEITNIADDTEELLRGLARPWESDTGGYGDTRSP